MKAVCSTYRDALGIGGPIDYGVVVKADTAAREIYRIVNSIHRYERGYKSYANYTGITIRVSKAGMPAIECVHTFAREEPRTVIRLNARAIHNGERNTGFRR